MLIKAEVTLISEKQMMFIKYSYSLEKKDNLIFSYSFKKSFTYFELFQKETGFSVSIYREESEKSFRVTSFQLQHDTQLEGISIFLHEAAILELVLQSLACLFQYAQQQDMIEILFILSADEANNLTCFEEFFGACTSFMTSHGQKISFTLYNTSPSRKFLAEKIESIKKQIQQILWKAQREDRFLKNYLQSPQKGKPLFPSSESKKALPPMGKVIAFPCR